jgi:hypothetical protein
MQSRAFFRFFGLGHLQRSSRVRVFVPIDGGAELDTCGSTPVKGVGVGTGDGVGEGAGDGAGVEVRLEDGHDVGDDHGVLVLVTIRLNNDHHGTLESPVDGARVGAGRRVGAGPGEPVGALAPLGGAVGVGAADDGGAGNGTGNDVGIGSHVGTSGCAMTGAGISTVGIGSSSPGMSSPPPSSPGMITLPIAAPIGPSARPIVDEITSPSITRPSWRIALSRSTRSA